MNKKLQMACSHCEVMVDADDLIHPARFELNKTSNLFNVKNDKLGGHCASCVWDALDQITPCSLHSNYERASDPVFLKSLLATDMYLATKLFEQLVEWQANKMELEDELIEESSNVRSISKFLQKKNAGKGVVVKKVISPQSLMKELDEVVIGQEEAKRTLSYAVWRHVLAGSNDSVSRSNVLIAGNTGTGKTLMAETLAKILNTRFFTFDCTQITGAGYTGLSLSNLAQLIYDAKQEHLKNAKKSGTPFRAIVLLDEIDKLVSLDAGNGKIGFGDKIQREMLRMLHGGTYQLQYKTEKGEATVQVDMDDVLFIGCGAYEGLEEKYLKFTKKAKGIGLKENKKNKKDEAFKFNSKTLASWGYIKQFTARFPLVTETSPLKKEDLLEIIKVHCLPEYYAMADCFGVKIEFCEKFLKAVVKKSMKENVGARGLKMMLENEMQGVWWEITSNGNHDDLTYTVTKNGLKVEKRSKNIPSMEMSA